MKLQYTDKTLSPKTYNDERPKIGQNALWTRCLTACDKMLNGQNA